ncbi:two-component system sensor histidine kinase [gut metagenome]|uniref:histidine kinase n=1 Tax=gut metagenome TaxID=749906 RepID=J9FBN7_9ZZZZ
MNSVSKLKITLGYALLLAVLLFSLLFVHQEVETLTLSEEQDVQWADSLLRLLREKDANTIQMLRTLGEANEQMISASEIEHIIAEQDTVVVQQRVQRRVITHRDTVVTQRKKKGFFRRLGEAFVPPKKDSAIRIKTSLEFAVDTVIDVYNPVDSLQHRLRAVTEKKKKADNVVVRRNKRLLQRTDKMLTERIDSLLIEYEQITLEQAQKEAEHRQQVRNRSVYTIGWMAGGAVLLSAFFLVVIGRDVTRSNRYRKELEDARKQAEDLLATREKLMLAITHDFKAPLGSIMGYADLLSRLTVDERQRFYLDNMKTSSEHLLKLVVDLLDFHRLDLQKVEINSVTFQPSRLLEEIRVSFEPLTAEKGLKLYCEVDEALTQTYVCDPLRLRQIVTNLLSNAIKFTDQGTITLSANYENRKLVISVIDTGKGMAVADKERIFQEFTRLPSAQGKEGFGLGLSIVRMLVQLLEGTIEVDSELEKGSTFTVRIPIYPVRKSCVEKNETTDFRKDLPEVPAEKTDVATLSTCRKILLIDDDRIQLTLTSSMLMHSGMTAVTCMQVDELLDALRTESFDVLLTDVQMPAISGFDLLKLLRASNIPQAKNIPVIAVTARSDMQRDIFIDEGFAGCLHKPFTVTELLRELSGNTAWNESSESVASRGYNFAALTAFSGDDTEAATSILNSFLTENRLNIDRLREGLRTCNVDELARVAHKMIPLFTLIGASDLVAMLRSLEAARGTEFTDKLSDQTKQVLISVEEVLSYLSESL